MNKVLLVAVLLVIIFTLASGCGSVSQSQFEAAQRLCASHGGVKFVELADANRVSATCQNDTHIYSRIEGS